MKPFRPHHAGPSAAHGSLPSPRRSTSRGLTAFVLVAAAVALVTGWAGLGRASAPPGWYTLTADTAHDTRTQLTWQRGVAPSAQSWANAQMYCQGLDLEGSGWRLPARKELETLIDESAPNGPPRFDAAAFPNTPFGSLWSSSPLANDPASAWLLDTSTGGTFPDAVNLPYQARCVR